MGDRLAMMVCPLRAVAAFTVSVCVATFAPFAVKAPVPVTVINTDPGAVSLKKKLALLDPLGIVRFEAVTAVVHVLSV
jgi:hypothetical protein